MNTSRACAAVILALVGTTALAGSAAGRARHLVESDVLASYAGDWYTVPTSINNRQEIAGYAVGGDDGWVAFIRSAQGRYRQIADRAFTNDINERGVVVGSRFACNGDDCWTEGFSWSREGGLQNLGSFVPSAVNDKGDMAGVCDSLSQACVMRDGVVSIVAGPGSAAYGINAKGDVVGSNGDRAFHLTARWQFNDLGRGVAVAINDRGVIAGHRWTLMGERGERAMVTAWTRKGPRSPGLEVGLAAAINGHDWVIANAFDENDAPYSFTWDAATNGRVTLAGAAGERVQLEDINDRGDVVGTAGMRAVIWRVRTQHLVAPRSQPLH